jgi:hypothetical protein
MLVEYARQEMAAPLDVIRLFAFFISEQKRMFAINKGEI